MIRRLLFLLTALLLTACSSGQTQTPEKQHTSSPTVAAATAAPAAATGSVVGCTAVSPRPTPGPTEQSIFPFPGASDWVKGPDTAAITIIEYSDFQ